jgi:hypothetical protein
LMRFICRMTIFSSAVAFGMCGWLSAREAAPPFCSITFFFLYFILIPVRHFLLGRRHIDPFRTTGDDRRIDSFKVGRRRGLTTFSHLRCV